MPMRSIEERMVSLEESNQGLAASVRGLTAALEVVNDLQVEQRATAVRVEEAQVTADAAHEAARVRTDRTNRAVKVISLGFAIVLPIVSMLVYASLIVYVNDLLTEQRDTARRGCEVRNRAALVQIRREETLARLETEVPAVARAHQESADDLRETVIDCAARYPRS